MTELEHNGYYPLTREHLLQYVPTSPGVYMLAIRLVSGAHQTFFTSQSENLYASLQRLNEGDRSHLPLPVQSCMEKFQTYFTYFIILRKEYQSEIEKMLTQTIDPVLKLTVLNDN